MSDHSDDIPFFDSQRVSPVATPEPVDSTSIPVKLSSLGKLSMPELIHVRDYSLDDSLLLATANDESLIRNLVRVLNNIIQGTNVDAANLHESEMEEILLTVYASFWQSKMELPYTPTAEELKTMPVEMKKALESGEYAPKIDIDLPSLGTKTLPAEFKEPFSITERGHEYSFRLPRIGDFLAAEDYIRRLYAFEEKNFQEIRAQLENNEEARRVDISRMKPVDPIEFHKYTMYMEDRGRKFLTVKQSFMLVAIDGNPLSTVEERLAATVPLTLWTKVIKAATNRFAFGVNKDIKIKSPISGVERDWRAPFRFMDLIPSSDVSDDSGPDIRFGV